MTFMELAQKRYSVRKYSSLPVEQEKIEEILKAGNSIETITAAIIQVMPYAGFPNAFAALKAVKEVINE